MTSVRAAEKRERCAKLTIVRDRRQASCGSVTFVGDVRIGVLVSGSGTNLQAILDPNGEGILYAFGLADGGKSVGAGTVFSRCRRIVETFSDEDVKFANFLMDRRNAELHSGEAALEVLPQASWVGSTSAWWRSCSDI